MKMVVTGAAGFIGSTLVQRLLTDDDVTEVVGIDCLTDYYEVERKLWNLSQIDDDRFTWVNADILDLDLQDLLNDADHVFHQAGQPGVRRSWGTDFAAYSSCNVDATQRLLEAAKVSSTLKSFIYASSSSVYGEAERYPTTETDRPQPRSPYGVTKLAAEHLCSLYAANFDVPTVSLRYFTVYGPRQRPDMAFTRFIGAVLSGSPITLYGDGTQVREFTFVEDIVDANIRASRADVRPGEVINLSGGSSVSVNEVLAVIGDLAGTALKIDRFPAVAGDVHRTGGSTDKARTLLGWVPQIGIEEGLGLQFDWLKALRDG